MQLDELIDGVRTGNALAIRTAGNRLELLRKRHKMAVRGGKRVCGHCTRGHDMKTLVIWPCADFKILSGMEAQNPNPTVETFVPGRD